MPRQFVLPIILLGFLVGCSSESALHPNFEQALQLAHHNKSEHNTPEQPELQSNLEPALEPEKGNKTACNKPYKIKGKTYYPMKSAFGYIANGLASWYGSESGNRTASGSRFNPKALSAAHKTLPIPSKVRVTNLRNGRHIDVLINDRGPFSDNKIIDLSQGAAEQIGLKGLTEVKVEYLGT
jgi:rare lipoprotein A